VEHILMIETCERMRDILPSATLALTAKAKELRAQGHPVVSLAAGEPDFAVPEPARRALVAALDKGLTRYTPTSGTPELRKAVAEKMKRDQGLSVTEANVVISCGAKHSLYNLLQVLCSEGDEVILPRPYWVSYPEMVKLAGARPVYADLDERDFQMTAGLIEQVLTPRSKVLILNSPANPTGAVIPEGRLREIADLVRRRGLFCISDEIYEYYVFDGARHVSIAQILPDWMDRVAVVNGMSKSYAMTGLRIGYTVAHPEIVKKIGILQDHSTSNPVSLSQEAATAALRELGPDYFRDLHSAFERKRALMIRLLEPVRKLRVFRPSGAFYVYVSVKGTGRSADEFARRLLEEKFVAAIPGESFGSDGWVRLSFAASESDIEEGCRRIREWIGA
jgi:aspartate aminotransferase